MADQRHLVGPGGLRVEPVVLAEVDVAYARRWHRDARAGETFFLVTRRGRLVRYCRDIEDVAELVDLTSLHAPADAGEDVG